MDEEKLPFTEAERVVFLANEFHIAEVWTRDDRSEQLGTRLLDDNRFSYGYKAIQCRILAAGLLELKLFDEDGFAFMTYSGPFVVYWS